MSNKPEQQKLSVTAPKDWAAGVPAVISAYQNVTTKVGPFEGTRLLFKLNQLEGFDCPGCAWPDPLNQRATFEFCENGAKAVADEATSKRLTADFFAANSVEQLKAQSDRWLNDQGRLVEPMLLKPGASHYQPISWEQALALVAEHLTKLNSPHEAAFYTSGRTSNEAAFLYQLFVRQFGTNNLPDCSNMCHESSGVGLTEAIGVGKGTVSLEDLENSQAIFIFGQNPGSNHPRMLKSLQQAKRRGAQIVSINPLDETGLKRFKNPQEIDGIIGAGTALRDLHLPVKINGDMAVLKGLCRELIERHEAGQQILDEAFISQYCYGFEAFKQDILDTNWVDIETLSGVSREQIKLAADIACGSQRTICCWAMGMTQHKNAVANIQLMTNFLMLQGNLGRPGAGVCPVRGHSNVQGDRTMGIWENPAESFLDALEQHYAFSAPRDKGFDAIATAHAMQQGKLKVFFALGGNFFRAMPDHQAISEGLAQCELSVQVSTKLNRSHLYTAKTALILPALGRTEIDEQVSGIQTVTVENSMGVVQTSHGKIPPSGPSLKSEVAIIAELAARVLPASKVNWLAMRDDYNLIRDGIAHVIAGFSDFNQRIVELGEFALPNPVRDARQFNTTSGKANFIVHPLSAARSEDKCLMMMTIRSHDQFNTTVYTDNDRYRGIYGSRQVLLVNAEDLAELGFSAGEQVDIHSHWLDETQKIRKAQGFTLVEYRLPRGCAAAYYPETNDLIPLGSVADKSNTPAYKSVVISLHRPA